MNFSVGIACALPKQNARVRVGNLNAFTLNGGVNCRRNSADKLYINFFMWLKD